MHVKQRRSRVFASEIQNVGLFNFACPCDASLLLVGLMWACTVMACTGRVHQMSTRQVISPDQIWVMIYS